MKRKKRSLAIGWVGPGAIRSSINYYDIPMETGTTMKLSGDEALVFIRLIQGNEKDPVMDMIRDLNTTKEEFNYLVNYNIRGCKKRIQGKGVMENIKIYYRIDDIFHIRLLVRVKIEGTKLIL